MNLFKKKSASFFIVFLILIILSIFQTNKKSEAVSNQDIFFANTGFGCFISGVVELDKYNYYPNESIVARGWFDDWENCGTNITVNIKASLNGGPLQIVTANQSPGSTTFSAPENGGNYSVVFYEELKNQQGQTVVSTSTSINFLVVNPVIWANPNPIPYGQTTTVNWSAPGASVCMIRGAGGGATGITGSLVTPILKYDTRYSISCSYPNTNIVENKFVDIQVNILPVSVNIEANPNPIGTDENSEINWFSSGADSCVSSNGQGGNGVNGHFTTPNLNSNTTYSVTCNRPLQTIPGQCGGAYWNVTVFLPCSGFNQSTCQNTNGCYWYSGGTIPASTGSDSETVVINNSFQISLYKPLDKIKNFIKAGSSSEDGKGHLNLNIHNLPANKSCQLQKNGVLYGNPYYADVDNVEVGPSNLTDVTNEFRLVCTDNNSTVTPPQNFLAQSGGLVAPSSCSILPGQNSCKNVPVSWTTVNPHNNPPYSTVITNNNGQILNTGTNNGNGYQNISIPFDNEPQVGGTSGTATLKLLNRVDGPNTGTYSLNYLDTKLITISCANSTWNGTICASISKPDLIASATTPVSAVVGTAQAFTTTVTNQGNADTNYEGINTFTNLFQTATGFEDPASQTEPIGVLSYAVAGMGVLNSNGGSSTASKSITFNSPGTYYVRACADKNSAVGLGVISESNEYNNCGSWTPVLVTTVAQPDLIAGATSPTLAVLNIGQTYTTSIRNQGTGSTGRGFQNLFQTATGFDDPTSFLGPINLLTHTSPQSTPTLGINASSDTTSPSITFSSVGNYYMRVCADLPPYNYGYITNESNENNNCGPWSLVQVSASSTINLRASNPTPTTATIGNPVNFTSIISNSGNTGTGNSFYNTFQIASEANGNGTLTRINSTPNPMPALGPNSMSQATSVNYTFTGSPTTRSVRACADINGLGNSQIAEIPASNELDNCSSWVNITFPNLSGNLSASNCQIDSGASSCKTSLNWNTINPISGGISAVTTNPNNTIVRTALSATNFMYDISEGDKTFYLYHSTNPPSLLAEATATASCLLLTDIWVNGKCTPAGQTYTVTSTAGSNGAISPLSRNVNSGATTTFTVTPNTGYVATITGTCPLGVLNGNIYTTGIITSNCNVRADFNKANPEGMTGSLTGENCEIEEGDSSCTTTLSWAINKTEAVASEITASGMTSISLNTPTIGGNYFGNKTVTVPHSERTFYLYNNGVSLVPTSESPNGSGLKITANCKLGTTWDPGKNGCISSGLPVIITSPVTDVTQDSAVSGGTIISNGGAVVTISGIVWSEFNEDPTVDDNAGITTNGWALGGPWPSQMNGLNNSLTYYVRAYATNANGTAYGNSLSFTTLSSSGLPVIITSPVTDVTQDSAVSGGTIISNGGAVVTISGIVWSEFNEDPTVDDNAGITTNGWALGGPWPSQMNGLNNSLTYYVRAYATNANGTAYGNSLSFTTLTVPGLPTVTTRTVTNVTQESATSGGEVTSQGSTPVTQRGIVWARNPNPTTIPGGNLGNRNSGQGLGTFSIDLDPLLSETEYYVRAYAVNSSGTAYGDNKVFTTDPGVGGGEVINIDFNASPKRIFKGRSSTLTWTTDAESCTGTASDGSLFETQGQPDGSYIVKPNQTTTYTLSCNKAGVSDASKDTDVKVSVIRFFEI